MSQDHARELEDLEQLLAEPGWARLEAYVAREWGPEAFRRAVAQALGGIPAGAGASEAARETVFQIEASTRAVERLMGWPRERVRVLRGKSEGGQTLAGWAAEHGLSTTWPRGGPA